MKKDIYLIGYPRSAWYKVENVGHGYVQYKGNYIKRAVWRLVGDDDVSPDTFMQIGGVWFRVEYDECLGICTFYNIVG